MVELHALMLFVVAALGIFAPAVPITLHRDEPQMQGQADVQAALIGAAFGGPVATTTPAVKIIKKPQSQVKVAKSQNQSFSGQKLALAKPHYWQQ